MTWLTGKQHKKEACQGEQLIKPNESAKLNIYNREHGKLALKQ